ncbi:undecaprenyl-phosphate glucose phosphotransferase [Coralloluteibacterium stylophorae]|uniref:Undecaprenyl-phosphate glucose phosphotransferase n=1 Tax=Coralloluteibacterium stylophorae TaxID=1776034 RepID=A0A8J7VWN4_9GAMM|nr:undecaprenyl-phosphate glucose phosphotransferase [Coralloluteibacterium stylophorae]MBS7458541.1 undecaprenyl-phosphate glucose phosphotransferase [Coralloluteibacterium stylophorae]
MLVTDMSVLGGETQAPRYLSKYSAVVDLMLRVGDPMAVAATGLLAYWIRFADWPPTAPYQTALAALLLYAMLASWMSPLYRSWRGRPVWKELGVLAAVWTSAFALFSVQLLVLQQGNELSRLWLGQWYVGGYAVLALYRLCLRGGLGALHARGVDVQRTVVVGMTGAVQQIHGYLQANRWIGVQIAGYFHTRHDRIIGEVVPKCLGDMDDFATYLHQQQPEHVWIALPLSERAELKALLALLDHHPVRVRLVPDLSELGLLNQAVDQIGQVPVIDLRDDSLGGYRRIIKAAEDRLLAALALLALAPVMAAVAIGVKLSSRGPVFYRQVRVGLDGKQFGMLKFRSMPVDTEAAGVRWGNSASKAVTPFGRFIRKTSLDELPQFINVLRGEMSIVGPRPERPMFVDQFKGQIHWYMQKHLVKAGITGLAQVNGWRGDTDLDKRIECDLHYIRNWSLWLDLRIIAATAFKVLHDRSAS